MPEQTTNTQPTDTSSWAVSFGQKLGQRLALRVGNKARSGVRDGVRSKVRPKVDGVVTTVVVRGDVARRWVVRKGQSARLTAREQASRLKEPRRLAVVIGSIAAFCVALMLLLVYAHNLTRRAPRWWNPTLVVDPALGEAIEMGLMRHLSAIRQPDPTLKPGEPWRSEAWSVSLTEEDANAWLNSRLPKWMMNRGKPVPWPVEIASLQAKFEDGTVRLGVQILDNTESVIAGVSIAPEIREDGSLWLRSSGLDIGSLPAPAWAIGTARSAYSDSIPEAIRQLPETEAFFGALAGSNAIFPNATIKLDGGRRVRVLSITSKNGRVDLKFRTEFVGKR